MMDAVPKTCMDGHDRAVRSNPVRIVLITHDKPVRLIYRTHALDVGKHPRLDAELHSTSNDCSSDLSPEHRARGHFHVVAELEIRCELERLEHRDVSPRLEHHHGHRTPWERVSDDELGDDVKADLLVSDSLDDTDGDDIDECDDKGQDKRPDWELRRPDFNSDDTKHEHRHCIGSDISTARQDSYME